ncbi:TPA: acyltransferase family protein, partial [Bacillus nitratireducens]
MKGLVTEMFFLRTIACLSVVFIHAISVTFENLEIRKDPDYFLINSILFAIQILLMFGTPMFVFISEFLLSYAYKDKMPSGFMKKRIKYILIPYVSMGIFYSFVRAVEQGINSFDTFLPMAAKMIFLGDFHGYFILIIFQFYLLHYVFVTYVEKFNTKYVIAVSVVINLLYLGFFNFQSKPVFIEQFYWEFIMKMPFLAWIAYFVIAFYCGRNLEKLKTLLSKYNKLALLTPFVTGVVVLVMCYSGL